ncbi:PCNA-associated factor-like [Hyalella azteca]|uniref:PCNA-associated factor n=1 Tax=Hyalella azteca TaxID=294128 RepID=A0A979FS46_HYAAZ|nr:PCNA-associated factor-like [Hyalella azteca]
MVRTKADAGSTRVSAAKAPRKMTSSASASPLGKAGSSKERGSGGNSYNPQPTPSWQKGISRFFKPISPSKENVTNSSDHSCTPSPTNDKMDADAGPSSSSTSG